MLAILLLSFVVVSCDKEEDPPAINEAEVLVKYLESPTGTANNYGNTTISAIHLAEHVKALNALSKVYIIDIRSASDFATGHIENAVNVGEKDVLTHLENTDLSSYDEISIVCKSGQTAGWVACLARVLGYDNVFAMKWGMCSWHSDFAASWNGAIGNTRAQQFTADASPKANAGELPVLNTGSETGEDILEARVNAVNAEGFAGVNILSETVFGALANYYIVNYWAEDEYLDPGHIPGAIQYTPKGSFALDAYLKTLPTDKTVVVYCHSGQNSAAVACYLRLIGYDAKSLKFGTNGMIYDLMPKSTWGVQHIKEYAYVT